MEEYLGWDEEVVELEDNTKPDKQLSFFNLDEYTDWKKEWKGMPEFIQPEIEPFREIIVRFEDQKSVDEFAVLMNQTITMQTKYLWFPEITISRYMDKEYIDEKINGENRNEYT